MKTSTPEFFCLNVIFVTQKDIPFTHVLLPINKKKFHKLSSSFQFAQNCVQIFYGPWESAKQEYFSTSLCDSFYRNVD